MIVDASAIVAIVRGEPGDDALLDRLLAAPQRATHAVSFYEAALATARTKARDVAFGEAEIASFCGMTGISISAIGADEAAGAISAFARYGKGRHPARLNMGDCFSYACAKLRGVPLLYKGDGFAQTDLA